MSRKKWTEKRLTLGFSKLEIDILEDFCSKNQREKTEVIRELVRNLKKVTHEQE